MVFAPEPLEEFEGYGNCENDKKLVNYFPKKIYD
ncbi:Protein of unknown function [Bacillus mycoides]|nr:Protein of unknown function [Bacillus mycoides]